MGPPKARKEDGIASTDLIGNWSSHERADDGSTCECGAYATLHNSLGIVEVFNVLVSADNGGHGGYVEAKTEKVVRFISLRSRRGELTAYHQRLRWKRENRHC